MSSRSSHRVTRPNMYRSQQGLVAIMVTMVLIVVITLIVLGFAQIIRRNQRQALDHQLSTQAFYAAESGVNDVRRLIKAAVDGGHPVVSKPNCGNSGGTVNAFYYTGADALQPDLNTAANVKYVCVIVDAAPTELTYESIGSTSTIIPVVSNDGTNLQTVKLTWQAKGVATPMTGCGTGLVDRFTDAASWSCGYGVLRFDLVPTNSGSMNIDNLANGTMTSFAVPVSAGGETSPIAFQAGTSNTKNIFGASCDNTNCTATINVASVGSNNFHLRVSSVYKSMSLRVSATTVSGAAELTGAQATIDSTGKAQDVARRIKVTVPLRTSSLNALPDFALQSSDSICKRFSVMDNYYTATMPTVGGVTVQGYADNDMCKDAP